MEPSQNDFPEQDVEHQNDNDFQFDPDCTLILYGLNGRNPKGLLKKFLAIGPVTFWQPVIQYDTAIVAYASPELAKKAKDTIDSEKILFCTEDTSIPSNSLLLPPQMRSFLTSPPPSPPEDWAPHHEDINRIAFSDLKANELSDGRIQLLPRTVTAPSIVMTPEHGEQKELTSESEQD